MDILIMAGTAIATPFIIILVLKLRARSTRRKWDERIRKLKAQLMTERGNEAARELGELGAEEAAIDIVMAIKDRRSPVLWEGLDALVKMRARGVIILLKETLKDMSFLEGKPGNPDEEEYCKRVIDAIRQLDQAEYHALMIEIVRGDYGEFVRRMVREEVGVMVDISSEISRRGFQKIARITYGLPGEIYWNPELKMELLITRIGERFLVKGQKKYYVKAVSDYGLETWDRSLGELMDRLRVSFPEFHLYATGIMRISEPFVREMIGELEKLRMELEKVRSELERESLSERELEESYQRLLILKSTIEREIRRDIGEWRYLSSLGAERNFEGFERFAALSLKHAEIGKGEKESVETIAEMTRFKKIIVKERKKELKDMAEKLENEIRRREKELRELRDKGAATCYVIGFSTIVREATEIDLGVVLDKTVEDIVIADRYGGFTQSLEKALRIYHEDVKYPWLVHIAEYVGMIDPGELVGKGYSEIIDQVVPMYIVTSTEDISVDGRLVAKGKRTPARVVKAFLERVEKVPPSWFSGLPSKGGWLGNVALGEIITDTPLLFPLDKLIHGYISGTTGAGKSYLARVVVENAILDGVTVVILDPTRQWSGIVKPASGSVLRRFDRFGIPRDAARGFPADVIFPEEGRIKLPEEIEGLFRGCTVLSMRGMEDAERCRVASRILRYAYETHDEESERLKTLIVLEEAHSFLPENVSPDAKAEATEVRNWIDRISREMRKYGLNLLLITQSLSDFRREARIVREAANTKFFMRATDRTELQYISDYLSNEVSETVRRLAPGEAVLTSPFMDPVKFAVRPPLSHVGELDKKDIETLREAKRAKEDFLRRIEFISSGEDVESRILWLAREYERKGKPLIVKDLEEELGMSRKKLREILKRMEEKGLIRTRRLKKKGRPRVIIPVG